MKSHHIAIDELTKKYLMRKNLQRHFNIIDNVIRLPEDQIQKKSSIDPIAVYSFEKNSMM